MSLRSRLSEKVLQNTPLPAKLTPTSSKHNVIVLTRMLSYFKPELSMFIARFLSNSYCVIVKSTPRFTIPRSCSLESSHQRIDNFIPDGKLDSTFLAGSRDPSPKPSRARMVDVHLSDRYWFCFVGEQFLDHSSEFLVRYERDVNTWIRKSNLLLVNSTAELRPQFSLK